MRSLLPLALTLFACSGAASPGVDATQDPTSPPPAPTSAKPGPPASPPATPPATAPKHMFLTVQSYKADFRAYAAGADGFEAADAICTKEAAAAKLGGTWKAYLSGRKAGVRIDAPSRIVGEGPWLAVDGKTVLFETRASLGVAPKTEIQLAANGQEWDAPGGPWTGTTRGIAASLACDDANGTSWQNATNRQRGVNGNPDDNDRWMDDGSAKSCDQPAPLYCFEQ